MTNLPFDEKFYRFDKALNGWVIKTITYICPECKRTVNQPAISTYNVNTLCTCRFPNNVTQMVAVGI